MTKETMTVHKALAELKTLDSRISTVIKDGHFCIAKKHSVEKVEGGTLAEYETAVKSHYDKATDLIRRRKAIKRAVVLSNAVTKVTINGTEYTVAEAIEMKNHGIDLDTELMLQMLDHKNKALAQIEHENGALENKADNFIMSMFGQKERKVDNEEIRKAREDFIKASQYELIDPINVTEKIDALNEHIQNFESEVDAALSVSNAVTTIEIEY